MKKIFTKSKICIGCKDEFERPYGQGIKLWNKRKFCSHPCYSKNLKGKKGHSFSIEAREKIGNANRGKNNGMYGKKAWNTGTKGLTGPNSGSFDIGIIPWNKGSTGENSTNWKNGVTALSEKIRECFKSKRWRTAILKRDNWTCQSCDKTKMSFEVHHIKRFSVILRENKVKTLEEAIKCKELWNINNGITLCRKCHKKTKKNHEEEYEKFFLNILKQNKLQVV